MKYLLNTRLQGSNFYIIERILIVATENSRFLNEHFSERNNAIYFRIKFKELQTTICEFN